MTERVRKVVPPVWADLRRAWVWSAQPPSLREVIAGWRPSVDQVLDGSGPLRVGLTVWNVVVAVPATAVLYAAAWLLQHPARAVVAALVVVPTLLMWIM